MAKVFITGDVHHPGCGTLDYRNGFRNEMSYVLRYCKILKKHKLRATLFVTGKCLEQHKNIWQYLISNYPIEIGGHTYAAFDDYPKGKGFLNKKLYGCFYGSRKNQKKDMDKFFEVAEGIGLSIKCWRTHAYSSNGATRELLEERGIKVLSDSYFPMGVKFFKESHLCEVIVTAPPDDVFFADRNKSNIPIWKGLFDHLLITERYCCLQLHPTIMKSLDNFELLEWVCKQLPKRKSYYLSQAPEVSN